MAEDTPADPEDQTRSVTTDYRFAPIPEEVIYGALSDKAVRIYGALMRHGLTPKDCFPSHARIARLIHCAERSVQRPLRELEESGWILRVPTITPRGRTSDGFLVRTSSAPPTQESAVPARNAARSDRAEERVEGKPEEREQGNEPSSPPTVHARGESSADNRWDPDLARKVARCRLARIGRTDPTDAHVDAVEKDIRKQAARMHQLAVAGWGIGDIDRMLDHDPSPAETGGAVERPDEASARAERARMAANAEAAAKDPEPDLPAPDEVAPLIAAARRASKATRTAASPLACVPDPEATKEP